MDRRRKLLLALLISAPIVAVAACTFPEVTFTSADSGPDSNSSSGSSGTSGTDSGNDAQPVFDAGVDVVVRDDGSTVVTDPSICVTRPKCDCDHDGYLDDTCVADAGDAGDAGYEAGSQLHDCDDRDPLRHPNAEYSTEGWDANAPGKVGDWDCNGTVDKTPKMVKCNSSTNIAAGTQCGGGTDGYLAPTECGKTNDVYTCPSNLILIGQPGNCDQKVVTTDVKAACK